MPSTLDDDASYERLIAPLVELAVSKFQLSPDDAQLLAHEVLLANIRHLEKEPLETRLLAAMTNALQTRHSR